MSLKAGDVLGGCEIVAELGEGGMGTVYRARQISLGREVALKVMQDAAATPDQEARFRRETKIHLTLNHPCVVRVYDSGSDGARDYLVMELVRGRALEDVIDRDAPMPLGTVATIGRDVVDALIYLHGKGIVHRDLKPRNVFLTEEQRAKVGDFGLAFSDGSTVLTRQGALVGTVKYLAPEAILGADPGPPADLYALGVFLFRMVTGALPYEGTSTQDWLKRITAEVPPRASTLRADTPPALDDLIARLLVKRPEQRATAAETRAVFGSLLGETGDAPVQRVTRKTGKRPISATVPTPAPPPPERRLGPAIAVAAVTAALTFGVGLALRAPPAATSAPPAPETPARPAAVERKIPIAFYPTPGAKDAYAELHRTLRGTPLEAGRGAAGFLVTDPARVEAAVLDPMPLPLAAVNGARPADPATVPPLALHAGWNMVEWPQASPDLARVKLSLRVQRGAGPGGAVVPPLPESHAARLPELWKLVGGGLSVTEGEKMARALMAELPREQAPQRLLGIVLVVLARHRREIEKDKASDLFLGTAGMLALGSRSQAELAGEGLGWLFRAIDREPRDAEAWAYTATGFAVLSRLDLAEEALQHAAFIGPEEFASWYQVYEVAELARIEGRMDSGRRDRTLSALKHAERLASTDTQRRQVAGALNQLTRAKAAY